ncbi:MAG: TonB-dependent receptor [Tannerellaceae bacterium]|jgi:outer membrane cobalamin receptor|nr:TonB-dependent receptor [Tannerellaceae bacterium]
MKNFVLLFLWFVCCFQAGISAQSKISLSGTVKDVTGAPLPQVTVAIEQSLSGTYTNDQGFYTLEILPGKYTFVVSMIGYKTLKKEIEVRNNKKQHFILEENSISLDVVEVLGKSRTQQVKEGVFAVNALDIKPLVNNLNSVSTLVNRTTGIKVREEGGVGSDFDLSINGMSGNSVRYFLDGVPLNTKGSEVSLANLPVNIIDRVEIYKGVVPAYLGADALGGAINIITKQNQRNYLDVSYGTGSFHTHRFNMNARYQERKTGIILSPTVAINYSKNDYMMKGVELWDNEDRKFKLVNRKRFHDDYFYVLAQLEGGVVNRSWADAFWVSLSYSATDNELQTGTIQQIVYGEAKRTQDAWNISARYEKKQFILPNLHLNASLSYTWDHSLTVDTAFRKYWWDGSYIESSRNEITGRGRSLRHYKRPLTVARLNLDYRLNEHHSVNLNYLLNRTGNSRYDAVDTDFEPSDDVLAKHILGLSYNQLLLDSRLHNTFFIKDYINYLSIQQQDLYWITGSKNKVGDKTTNYVGYGVGSRYNFFDYLSLKASFEHSVRLPLSREMLGNGTTVYPNFSLKPENSNNVNAGIYGSIRLARGHLLYYEANGFYRHVKDYIHAVVSQSEGLSQYDNVSNVDVKGVEGELRYTWNDRLQLIVNCSYQDSRSKTKYYADGSLMITYNNKIPNRPWLFSNSELNFTRRNLLWSNSTFRAGYTFEYVHWYYLTWDGYGSLKSKSRIPDQYIHNMYFSQSFGHDRYHISFECTNLLDHTVYDNYMLQKPGRAVFCKFRLFIN